ncbi:gluconate 2-dehydrogenase subunit 3 family protein [Reichenbachiella sp. MALMAid0571]|uniref:gluconate 2-dehydrogenase subunit 3 family protein n=1 Tax=Reichenbachiella sp. MALMAid0571 TaxID=3143939 RepID=UPI0032DE499B
MKRREALKKTSLILKSVVLAPGVFSALQACKSDSSNTKKRLVLTDVQYYLVNAIADTIIPPTDTLGASQAQVGQFIDLLLKDVFEKDVRKTFLDGLTDFDKDCKRVTGKTFLSLDEQKRADYLKKTDMEVMGKEYKEGVPFYYTFKLLTVDVYFSTEEGVRQNLNYVPVPGEYQGTIEWKEGDRMMIGNNI